MHRVPCPAGPSKLSALANSLTHNASSPGSSPFAPLGAVRSRSGPSPSRQRRTQEYKARLLQGQWSHGPPHTNVIEKTQNIINAHALRPGNGPHKWKHEKGARAEELRLVNKLFETTTMPWTAPSAEALNQPMGTEMDVVEPGEGTDMPPGVDHGSLVQICTCVVFSIFFFSTSS